MSPIIFSSKQSINLPVSCSSPKTLFKEEGGTYLFCVSSHEEFQRTVKILSEQLYQGVQECIPNILDSSFDFLSETESEEVSKRVRRILNDEKEHILREAQERILNLTKISTKINLDGFYRFVIRDYHGYILELIEQAIDDYLMEEDYQAFLGFLHCFVELESPQLKKLFVVVLRDGRYRFYDENYCDITDLCNAINISDGLVWDYEDAESENDWLLGILIACLPEQIYLFGTRNIKNKKIITTIDAVFRNRVVYTSENHEL